MVNRVTIKPGISIYKMKNGSKWYIDLSKGVSVTKKRFRTSLGTGNKLAALRDAKNFVKTGSFSGLKLKTGPLMKKTKDIDQIALSLGAKIKPKVKRGRKPMSTYEKIVKSSRRLPCGCPMNSVLRKVLSVAGGDKVCVCGKRWRAKTEWHEIPMNGKGVGRWA